MALSQSALSELPEAIRAGGGEDALRDAMTLVLQELIELEASEVIGAARYERTDERTTHRNGSRTRVLSTKAGDVQLHIPKLREGSFFPALLEPRRRIDRALWAVIMEAYVHGVSTRKVDDLVVALGIDAGVKKSEVSRICGELDSVVADFRDRSLGHIGFPYVFLDATYVKAHDGASVVSKAVVIATGVTAKGDREVLGLAVGDSEDGAFWTAFLRSLRSRGLSGVRLVISDALLILDEPTRGIDVGTKAEIQKLVLSLAEDGKACLFISSELEEVLRVCHRIAVLREREKVAEFSGDVSEQVIMESIAGSET